MKAFRTTIKLDDVYITGVVKAKYRIFIGSKYQEWFIKGLGKWLQK